MKFLSAMLIAGLCVFSACDDDKDNDINPDTDPVEVPSELNAEEHKEKIANEGEAIVAKLGAVAELETYEVLSTFSEMMDESEDIQSSVVKFSLNEINSIKNATKEAVELDNVYKISDDFKTEAGVYNWNVQTKEWDKLKESETEITYKFKVDGKDSEISVFNFTSKDASIDEEQIGQAQFELPLSLNAHIKLGELTLSSFELSAEWNDDNTPKELVETFVLEGFTFKSELTKTDELISISTSFKLEDYTIFANEVKIDGNFDYETLLNTANLDNENEIDDLLGQKIIENGNISFQLGDIKAVGVFDATSFIKEINADELPTDLELIDLLNTHVQLYVKYAEENAIIAKGEFFLEEYEDYDGIDTEISLKMIFSDGSAVADSFFNTGFSAMISDISDLIEDINAKYDLDIDTID